MPLIIQFSRRSIRGDILTTKKDYIAYFKSNLLSSLINLDYYSLLSVIHITSNIVKDLLYVLNNVLRLNSVKALASDIIVDSI